MKCLGRDKSRHKTVIQNLPNVDWTDKEIQLLRDNYGIIHISILEKLLNRNRSAIIQYAKRHNIQSVRYWTQEQEEYLKEHYIDDYDDLCNYLGKTISAIQHKTSRLGLKRNARWTKSKLETEFESILKDQEINMEYQYQVGRAAYDYYHKESNTLIEVQGNYWHCNPKFFPNGPIDERQKNKLERDKVKKEIADTLEYNLLYIWEDDIYNNPQHVKQLLLGCHTKIAELSGEASW